jgi:uncharacterized protein YndB with AHSA1/START domain
MSVRIDESGRRWVEAEIEVPGTPEQVWAAVASAEGISSWFVPTELREDGTVVSHFGPGMAAVARKTAWEPLTRFAAEGEMEPGGPKLATEWLVEAKAGGTCVVRVVHSLFADTDDWDDQLGAIEAGWPDYFSILKLYLTHFPGESCAAFQLIAITDDSDDHAWSKLACDMGLIAATKGETRSTINECLELTGIVERIGGPGHRHQALLRLHAPAPGLAHIFAQKMGSIVVVSLRFYLYGNSAANSVALHEPAWRAWISQLFPSPTS